jgi:hypothetical protein
MTTEQDLQQAWAQAPKESSGYVQEWPPDGTYQALVRAFDDFEGKDGTEYVKTIFDITGPSHEGMPVEIINAKNVPERLGFLKEHFYLLGADVDSLGLDDIGPGSQARAELLDVPVELTVKTSKKTDASGQPYRNAYLAWLTPRGTSGSRSSDEGRPQKAPWPEAQPGPAQAAPHGPRGDRRPDLKVDEGRAAEAAGGEAAAAVGRRRGHGRVKNDGSRAPENTTEHVRQLLKVNDQQAVRIRELAAENEKLRSERVVLNGELKHLQERAA